MMNALTRRVRRAAATTMGSRSRPKLFFSWPVSAAPPWPGSGSTVSPGVSGAEAEASVSGSCCSSLAFPPGTSAAGLVAALLDAGCLAAQFPQVVQLGAALPTPGDRLDPVERRAVHREGPLDAHAGAHLAHGQGLPSPAALTSDHHARRYLDS